MIFVFLSFLININMASIPLPEGLFRHNSNAEINHHTVVFKFKITHQNQLLQDEKGPEVTAEAPVIQESYVRVIIENHNNGYRMMQIISNNAKFNDTKKIKFKSISDLSKEIETETNFNKKIFYSSLIMFGFSNSRSIFSSLKKVSEDLKSNEELINREKMHLLERYKSFLKDTKGADSARIAQLGLENPMKPLSEDKKIKVKQLLSEPMYRIPDNLIMLRKHYGKFAWNIHTPQITAWFENETKNILSLELNFTEGNLQWQYKTYKTFENDFQLPSEISLRTINSEFIFTLISADFYKGKNFDFVEKVQEYQTKTKASDYIIPEYLDKLLAI